MARAIIPALLLALVLFGGCKTGDLAQDLSPIPAPVQLDVSDKEWTELSTGVIANAGATNDGRLFVFGRGLGMSRAFHESASGPFDIALPAAPGIGGHWANDQLNAQLANGDLLLTWNGYSNTLDEEFKKSEWWNKWPTKDGKAPKDVGYPVDRDGVRPAQLIWRYVAKDDAWSPVVNKLDAAEVGAPDKSGTVVRSWCAQGVPWVAGFDRPELLADPWGVDKSDEAKQRLYLLTRCSRLDDDQETLFVSNDSGATWGDATIRLSGIPSVITSTPSGRIFIAQTSNVFISDDHGKTLTTVSVADGPPTTSFSVLAPKLPFGAISTEELGVGPPHFAPDAIATVGPSSVLVVYPAVEAVPNTRGEKRQVAVVALVAVPKKAEATPFVITPLKVIRSTAKHGSVLMPSFIADTRPVENPVNMLYWLETLNKPKNPGDPVKLRVRYAWFAGKGRFPTSPATLSNPVGWMSTKVKPYGHGDYMKGAFYYDPKLKTLNFVAVWPQETKPGVFKPFVRVMTMKADITVKPVSLTDSAKLAKSATVMAPTDCEACLKMKP